MTRQSDRFCDVFTRYLNDEEVNWQALSSLYLTPSIDNVVLRGIEEGLTSLSELGYPARIGDAEYSLVLVLRIMSYFPLSDPLLIVELEEMCA